MVYYHDQCDHQRDELATNKSPRKTWRKGERFELTPISNCKSVHVTITAFCSYNEETKESTIRGEN